MGVDLIQNASDALNQQQQRCKHLDQLLQLKTMRSEPRNSKMQLEGKLTESSSEDLDFERINELRRRHFYRTTDRMQETSKLDPIDCLAGNQVPQAQFTLIDSNLVILGSECVRHLRASETNRSSEVSQIDDSDIS